MNSFASRTRLRFGDVFLDERLVRDEIRDVIRRKQVLEFEAVDARRVRLLHIEVVVVVIEMIHHAHPERLGVAEDTIVDPLDVEVPHGGHVAVGLQERVNFREACMDLTREFGFVNRRLPERVAAILVDQRERVREPHEILVGHRKPDLAPVLGEILTQCRVDRVDQLLARDRVHLRRP
jgi:hypothetical protein